MKITTSEINKKQKSISVQIEGELVLSNCEKAKKTFLDLLSKHNVFNVKLENVEAIDLAFVQLLISFFDTAKNEKKQIKLTKNLTSNIETVLKNTGFNKNIEKYIES